MRRRNVITMLGAAVAAWPHATRAQQTIRVPLVGVLSPASPDGWTRYAEALRQGLRELGYVEGRNIALQLRFAGGVPARLPGLVAELVAAKPDVLVVGSMSAVLVAKKTTQTVPIVMMAASGDPVTVGLVDSLARPGGNVTGVIFAVDEALSVKRLSLLRELVPSLQRVGVVLQSGDYTSAVAERSLPAATAALKLDIRIFAVASAVELDAAFAAAEHDQIEALYVVESPLLNDNRQSILTLAERLRRPVIYGFPEFASEGGLMSYGVGLRPGYRRAAGYVDRILKGAKSADLAVEQLSTYELVVNLKTAKALGLTIPPALLLRADEVIE